MFRATLQNITKPIITIVLLTLVISMTVFAGPDKKAKNAFEQGKYEVAVKILSEKLRKKDNHQDNIRLMEKCLANGFKVALREAEDQEAMGDLDAAVRTYERIRKIADDVSMITVLKEEKIDGKKKKYEMQFKVEDVNDKLLEVRMGAVEDHYLRGVDLQNKENWREAAISFRKAREYKRTYKDVGERYQICKEKGTLKIAIMPFANKSGKTQYGNIGELITSQIISSAINSDPEFLQFITRDYLNQLLSEQGMQQSEIVDQSSATTLGKKIGVHAFVFGKVLSIIPNFPSTITTNKSNSRTVKEYNSNTKKYYPVNYNVRYTIHKKEGSVKVQSSFQIIDVETGTIVSSETIDENKSDKCCWITFKGNEDTILQSDRALITDSTERSLAPPEMMVNDAATNLARTLARKLVVQYE